MAYLGRKVTGLHWTQFAAAHVPAALLALVIGAAAMLGAVSGRSIHLGAVPVLACAGLAAVVAGGAAAGLFPGVFLGRHGSWAYVQGEGLLRRRFSRGGRAEPPEAGGLTPVGEGSSKR
jgi:hypothetical protein